MKSLEKCSLWLGRRKRINSTGKGGFDWVLCSPVVWGALWRGRESERDGKEEWSDLGHTLSFHSSLLQSSCMWASPQKAPVRCLNLKTSPFSFQQLILSCFYSRRWVQSPSSVSPSAQPLQLLSRTISWNVCNKTGVHQNVRENGFNGLKQCLAEILEPGLWKVNINPESKLPANPENSMCKPHAFYFVTDHFLLLILEKQHSQIHLTHYALHSSAHI